MNPLFYIDPDDVPQVERYISDYKRTRADKNKTIKTIQKFIEENPCMKLEPFLKPSVAVPRGFGEIIKYLDKSSWDGSHSEHKDNLAILLSVLCMGDNDHYDDERWQQIPTEKMNWINESWFKLYAIPLKKGTEKGAVIDIQNHEHDKNQCRKIRLDDKYSKRALKNFDITNPIALTNLLYHRSLQLQKTLDEPRKRILLNAYNKLLIPTYEEVKKRGLELVSQGYTKKGRKLIKLSKRSDEKFLKENGYDVSNLSESKMRDIFKEKYYVLEDHLIIFKNFIANGWRLPNQQDCGRVDDSMTSLPEWIRLMFKFENDESVVEVDCVALHVNLLFPLAHGYVSIESEKKFLDILSGILTLK